MAFRTNKTPVLQEKSASGAVASFNTALAMPLASCNIAVNAWQEGSGTPSPDNVRPIHGFSEVNCYQRGINLWDEEWEMGYITASGNNSIDANSIRSKNFSSCLPSTSYCFITPIIAYVHFYDRNKTWIERKSASAGVANVITSSNNAYYFRLSFYGYGTTYNNDVSFNYPSTDKNYHAYTGNIYTIQLGQEVYGAEVDVVNGVAHCTHKFVEYGENDVVSVRPYVYNNMNGIVFRNIPDITYSPFPKGISNMSNKVGYAERGGVWCGVGTDTRLFWIGILDILNMETVDEFKSWVADNHLQVVFELSERDKFDIQLTPTQIATIQGNNTIFADTGDIDLTYKDLDIAKRGNFREVFKLPS